MARQKKEPALWPREDAISTGISTRAPVSDTGSDGCAKHVPSFQVVLLTDYGLTHDLLKLICGWCHLRFQRLLCTFLPAWLRPPKGWGSSSFFHHWWKASIFAVRPRSKSRLSHLPALWLSNYVLFFTKTLKGRYYQYYYFCFSEEETEAQDEK